MEESATTATVSCQCQYPQMNCMNGYHNTRICEHLCAVAIFDDEFTKVLTKALETNSGHDKMGGVPETTESTNSWQENMNMLPPGIQLQR